MNKKILKHLAAFAILAFLAIPVVTFAETGPDVGLEPIESEITLGNADPRTTVARIINFALLFLGVIAVGLILIAGFKWMTAAGNEDKVEEAQELMKAAVIGLVIILSAWGIATFVLEKLLTATGA